MARAKRREVWALWQRRSWRFQSSGLTVVAATDMRKSIDGLTGLILSPVFREPNVVSLFLFIIRRRDHIRIRAIENFEHDRKRFRDQWHQGLTSMTEHFRSVCLIMKAPSGSVANSNAESMNLNSPSPGYRRPRESLSCRAVQT